MTQTNYLQSPSLLEFLEVTLTLQRRPSCQEYIFDSPINVLLPGCEPRDFIIMDHVGPSMSRRRRRNFRIFADVDSNLFRKDSSLKRQLIKLSSTFAGYFRNHRHTFNNPVLGCSPRPLKRPGGSTLKFPTFSFLPSSKQCL